MIAWPSLVQLSQDARLEKCTLDDLEVLRTTGQETYFEAFASLNSRENMDAYLESAFSHERIKSELLLESSAFYFLLHRGALAGYIKLNVPPAQSDLNEPGTLEIERIYIIRKYQSAGLGRKFLETAEQIGIGLGCTAAWLGVWEKNVSAIGFYKHMGYVEAGRHPFRMGEDVQSDIIMKKPLADLDEGVRRR